MVLTMITTTGLANLLLGRTRGPVLVLFYGRADQTLYTRQIARDVDARVSLPFSRALSRSCGARTRGDLFHHCWNEFPAGSVYLEPGGMNHFAQTGGTRVIAEISASGSTETRYFNPADHK